MRSKVVKVLFALFAVSWSMSGCYEGWELPPPIDSDSNEEPPINDRMRPIDYLLVESFRLSDVAVADDDCFEQLGIRQFRLNEWSLRNQAIIVVAEELANEVVVVEHHIGSEDCQLLSAITEAAFAIEPWQPQPGPSLGDDRGRIAHLKIVYWQTEPPLAPIEAVATDHWFAMRRLWENGADVTSLHYYVVQDELDGYFSIWREAVEELSLTGSKVTPDLSEAGQMELERVVAQDMLDFQVWMGSFF